MTCPRSCSAAVTQAISNNAVVSVKALKKCCLIRCPTLLLRRITRSQQLQRSYAALCQAKHLSKSWRWFSWEGRRGGMDTCVLTSDPEWQRDSWDRHLGGYFKRWQEVTRTFQKGQVRMKSTGWAGDRIPFFCCCCVTSFVYIAVQVPWHLAPHLWAITSLRPP